MSGFNSASTNGGKCSRRVSPLCGKKTRTGMASRMRCACLGMALAPRLKLVPRCQLGLKKAAKRPSLLGGVLSEPQIQCFDQNGLRSLVVIHAELLQLDESSAVKLEG